MELAELLPQLTRPVVVAVVAARRRPDRVQFVAVLLDVSGALLGEVDDAAAVGLLHADQALVLQLGQGGVDRSRARAPGPAGALADLLDDLVAVSRLLR